MYNVVLKWKNEKHSVSFVNRPGLELIRLQTLTIEIVQLPDDVLIVGQFERLGQFIITKT